MQVRAMFSVIPIGGGTSLSRYVAACERVVAEAGLVAELHAHGTNIEGEWNAVMEAIRGCHEAVHAMGVPRVSTFVKLGTRTDRETTMADMVDSVRRKVDDPAG
jgi:uncharacterized protein (TIGR00106 family)